jgi:hypothetical protein
MKVRLECSVCGKIHRVDLRKLDDIYACDACSSECEVPERTQIDKYESALKRCGWMGICSAVFAISAVISYYFWMDLWTLNPSKKALHEIAQIIMYTTSGLALIFGMLEGYFNRQIYF